MPYFRALLVLFLSFAAFAADNSLQSTLARMDSAAAGFKGLRADLTQTSHVDVLNDDTVETGKIAVRRASRKDVRMTVHMAAPNERKVSLGKSIWVVAGVMSAVGLIELYVFSRLGVKLSLPIRLVFMSFVASLTAL